MDFEISIPHGKETIEFQNHFRISKIYISLFFHLHAFNLSHKRIFSSDSNIYSPWDKFTDVHMLFISIGNVKQLFNLLCEILPEEKEIVLIRGKYKRLLIDASKFRDEIEHLAHGRIDGSKKIGSELVKMNDPNDLGSLKDGVYSFGGDSIDLTDLISKVKSFETDLRNWNEKSLKIPVPE